MVFYSLFYIYFFFCVFIDIKNIKKYIKYLDLCMLYKNEVFIDRINKVIIVKNIYVILNEFSF